MRTLAWPEEHTSACILCPCLTVALVTDIVCSYDQGLVFDVTGNKAYQPGGSYSGECHFFLLMVRSV